MTQIALPLETLVRPPLRPLAAPDAAPPPGARTAVDAEGWQTGWEHARHGITPPADHLHPGHPVREGWLAGRAAFGARALAPSRPARLWLQLRLQCWLRGRGFDALLVTPRLIARLDTGRCPVTQQPLRDPVGAPSPHDATVLALCADATVSTGHLVVVSRRVALAGAALDAAQALARARDAEARPGTDAAAGLDAAAWHRLAALLAMVTPLAPGAIPAWPLGAALALLPPPRLRVLHPGLALQALLTQCFAAPAYGRRMGEIAALLPPSSARRAYFQLMSALLARRLSARPGAEAAQQREVLEQAWSHPVVRQRWQLLAQALGSAGCARLIRLTAGRGLTPGARWVDDNIATEGWALQGGGRAGSGEAATPGAALAAPAAGLDATAAGAPSAPVAPAGALFPSGPGPAAAPIVIAPPVSTASSDSSEADAANARMRTLPTHSFSAELTSAVTHGRNHGDGAAIPARYRGAALRAGALGTSRPAGAMSATRRTPASPITRSSSDSST